MNVEKVEVYDVNGYLVCATDYKALEEYLSDVPEEQVEIRNYLGVRYIKTVGKEFKDEKCKELQHLKINVLYETSQAVKQVR